MNRSMPAPKLQRDVFYFHGFDRRGPRYFNLWQKREARVYAERHGDRIHIGEQDGKSWTIEGETVLTRFHVMDWSDLIGKRMARPFWVGLGTMFIVVLAGIRQGYYGRLFRRDWGLATLSIWGVAPLLLWLLALSLSAFAGLTALLWSIALGLGLFWLLWRFDRYFGIFYIAHIAWAARHIAKGSLPELEARLTTFSEQIGSAKADDVIVVGHSIGAALAVRAVAAHPTATLLTVAHSIPLVSLQREAANTRDALEKMKADGRAWIDVSAGRDLLGFHAFDPSGGGAACVSAHLKSRFGAEAVKRLRWRGFETHFLYFRANLTKGPWDWLAILSQSPTISERFGNEARASGLGERRQLF